MCNKLCNWGNFYSGRLPWSGRWFALDGRATLDTPGASRFWTLAMVWTLVCSGRSGDSGHPPGRPDSGRLGHSGRYELSGR